MSEFKGTPGPWEIVYRDDDHCMTMTVIAQKGSMGATSNICRLSDDKNQANVIAITWHQILPWAGQEAFNNEQGDANDRLIATAPELLDQLIKTTNELEEEVNSRYNLIAVNGQYPSIDRDRELDLYTVYKNRELIAKALGE